MSVAGKEARQFLLSFHLRCFTSADLEQALQKRGFTLVEYSHSGNDRDVVTLLTSLRLMEYAAQHSAFTYADANLRIVFLQENLSEQEKQILLSHELGHVCCHHLEATHPALSGVLDEQEANFFAEQLLTYNRHCRTIRNLLLAAVIICCAVLMVAILQCRASGVSAVSAAQEQVCLTHTGECYHRSSCPCVQGKNNLLYVTVEEAEHSGYRPCKICMGTS